MDAPMGGMAAAADDGAEGPRARKMREVIAKAMDKTLDACSYARLVACFPNASEAQAKALRDGLDKLGQFLRESVDNEVDLIFQETDVRAALNRLDGWIEASAHHTPSEGAQAREMSADPEAAVRARTVAVKMAERTRLLEELAKLESEHTLLEREIRASHAQVEGLCTVLASKASEIKKAAVVCADFEKKATAPLSS